MKNYTFQEAYDQTIIYFDGDELATNVFIEKYVFYMDVASSIKKDCKKHLKTVDMENLYQAVVSSFERKFEQTTEEAKQVLALVDNSLSQEALAKLTATHFGHSPVYNARSNNFCRSCS